MTDTSTRNPLALLIPGLDGTGKFYERHLEALNGRYRALPWEYPRCESFDFADLVEELGKATRDEEPGSIAVVGESFGGPVAMHYVLRYPERVRTLLLINTFPSYRRRLRIRLACKLVPLLRVRGFSAIKDYVVDRTLRLEGIPEAERRRYSEIVSLVHMPAYRRRLELVREAALRSRLREIRVPTVILASGRDKIVPSVEEARYMARLIPQSRMVVVPYAGHALLLTPGFSLADYL